MALHQKDIDRLLEPELTSDLEAVEVGELRVRRDACQRAEVALSYVRRLLQGELDIVAAELEARGKGVRGDTGRMLEDLPTILAGPVPTHRPKSMHTSNASRWPGLQKDGPNSQSSRSRISW